MVKELKFLQCNLHCSADAANEMSLTFLQLNCFIALITEPFTKNNAIKNLNCGVLTYEHRVFDNDRSAKPRAAILCNKEVKFLVLNDFLQRDLVAIEVNLNNWKFVVCSVYVENESLNLLDHIERLCNFCKKYNKQLIVGGDFNGHNTNWGCLTNNTRGMVIMEMIERCNLMLLNEGSKPTYRRINAATVIDLTLSTAFINTKIEKWNVTDHISTSDHKCIEFVILVQDKQRVKLRNPRKTNWEVYSSELRNKSLNAEFTKEWVKDSDLELAAEKFREIIIKGFETACQETVLTTNRKENWFTSHLAKIRKKVRCLERFAYSKRLRKRENEVERKLAVNIYRFYLTFYNKEI